MCSLSRITKLFSTRMYSNSSISLEEAYQSSLEYLKKRNDSRKQSYTFDDDKYQKLVFSDPHRLYRWISKREELVLLKFGEMTNSQWRQNYGPQLTRSLAKLFRIIHTPLHNEPPILPYDTESRLNLIANFNQSFVGRGNVILPEQTLSPPNVSFTIDSESLINISDQILNDSQIIRYASLFMIDLDYPDTNSSKLLHYCHWAHMNISISSIMDKKYNYPTLMEFPNSTWIPYHPPHPQRGTGYHRYLLILVGHKDIIQYINPLNTDTRILDIYRWWDKNENGYSPSVLSYVWFRSCWTSCAKNQQNLIFGNTRNIAL